MAREYASSPVLQPGTQTRIGLSSACCTRSGITVLTSPSKAAASQKKLVT